MTSPKQPLAIFVMTLSMLATSTAAQGQQQPSNGTPSAQPAKPAAPQKYRVVTQEDDLSCSFSQDLSISMGSGLSGSASASANHFTCLDKAGKEVEIALISKNPNVNVVPRGGKIGIRTKQFGMVLRDEEGAFSLEMTEAQIKLLKAFLGLPKSLSKRNADASQSAGAPADSASRHEAAATPPQSDENADWARASSENTPDSYLAFNRAHPQSARVRVFQGPVTSITGYMNLGNGMQPFASVTIDGKRYPLSEANARKWRFIDRYETVGGYSQPVMGGTIPNATVLFKVDGDGSSSIVDIQGEFEKRD
jgi:hypothetical protein